MLAERLGFHRNVVPLKKVVLCLIISPTYMAQDGSNICCIYAGSGIACYILKNHASLAVTIVGMCMNTQPAIQCIALP
jgi:hypothetical protein